MRSDKPKTTLTVSYVKAKTMNRLARFSVAGLAAMALAAQTTLTPTAQIPATNQAAALSAPEGYILGPGDIVTVFVQDMAEEFADKSFRIDFNGDVSLPTAGHVHAAGLTTYALESEIKDHLSRIIKKPQVVVLLVAFGSQSVSVMGAVNNPGIRQLEGHKTLFEMLSQSGGLRPDAGYLVNVTREIRWGRIPLADAKVNDGGATSTALIKLRDLISATNPQQNIAILPGDAISVPKADLVYAVGSVTRPGGFPLDEHESLSALQVISLAQGLQRTAASSKAKILRSVPGNPERIELAVNLKALMAGKGTDLKLKPDDILFVPSSTAKSVGYKAVESMVGVGSGLIIYGRY